MEGNAGDLGPNVVDSELGAEPQTSNGKRKRTDLTEYKGTLEEFWKKGMQNKRTDRAKELIKEAAVVTGLEEDIVEHWVYNRRVRVKPPSGVPSRASQTFTITAEKAISGYNLHNREFFRGKSGRSVTKDAAAAWRGLSAEQKKKFNTRAAQMKMAQPSQCNEGVRQRDIKKLYKRVHETLKKLQDCGCDAYFMATNHNTKKVLMDGTPAGVDFMKKNYPEMLWDFGTGVLDKSDKTDSTVRGMQDEVMAMLNEKWQLASGTNTSFPYSKLKEKVVLEGWPEGIQFGKPRGMGEDRLKPILSCKDKIVVKVREAQPGCSKDSDGPNAEDNLLQIEEALADAASADAGMEYALVQSWCPEEAEELPLAQLSRDA
ncbi:uncharacterized protein LOC144880541 [Branchiostoma floridae x Branchiostoma japonicum]